MNYRTIVSENEAESERQKAMKKSQFQKLKEPRPNDPDFEDIHDDDIPPLI